MSLPIFLSDEDHPCVFCRKVSEKGIVGQVQDNRFFICADCLEVEVLLLIGMLRMGKPESGEPYYCVLCGKPFSKGHSLHIEGNWFFLCPFCVYSNVIPSILAGWWSLKWHTYTRLEQQIQLDDTVGRQQEDVDRIKEPLKLLIEEIISEGIGKSVGRFSKMFKDLNKNIFEDISKKIPHKILKEFAEAAKVSTSKDRK